MILWNVKNILSRNLCFEHHWSACWEYGNNIVVMLRRAFELEKDSHFVIVITYIIISQIIISRIGPFLDSFE